MARRGERERSLSAPSERSLSDRGGAPVERGASINVNAIGEMALLARLMLKGGHAPENIAQLALGSLQKRPSMQKRATTMAGVVSAARAPDAAAARSAREESRYANIV